MDHILYFSMNSVQYQDNQRERDSMCHWFCLTLFVYWEEIMLHYHHGHHEKLKNTTAYTTSPCYSDIYPHSWWITRKDKTFEEGNGSIKQKWIINEENKRDRYKMSVDPLWNPPLEMKLSIQVTDNLKPALMIGYYVRVTVDTSPGFNRPYDCGFLKEVRGYGSATMSTLQMSEVWGVFLFHDIPMIFLKPANYFGYQLVLVTTKRKRSVTVTPYPPTRKRVKKYNW